jgi:hypothetical protein
MTTPKITTVKVARKVHDRIEYERFVEAQYRRLGRRREFTPLDEVA